jgi:uncharacterized protein YxjI
MKTTKVYTLSDPDSFEIRYIGITVLPLSYRLSNHICDIKRENNKRTAWIKNVLKREKRPIIEELDEAESWEEGCLLEILYIGLFKSWGFNLVNGTLGGDGNIGYSPSKERRALHSISMRKLFTGEGNPFYGKHHSQKSKDLISLKNTGRECSEDFKEKRRKCQENWTPSQFTINRMIEVHGRRIVQLNKSLNFIKEFYTIKEAAIETNSLNEKITDCCKRKRFSHNNFVWMYKEDFEILEDTYKKELLSKLQKFKNYK